eukprot:366031-Chlamydomonas_euryale.AAC.19
MHSPEFAKIAPLGKIPVLVVEEAELKVWAGLGSTCMGCAMRTVGDVHREQGKGGGECLHALNVWMRMGASWHPGAHMPAFCCMLSAQAHACMHACMLFSPQRSQWGMSTLTAAGAAGDLRERSHQRVAGGRVP